MASLDRGYDAHSASSNKGDDAHVRHQIVLCATLRTRVRDGTEGSVRATSWCGRSSDYQPTPVLDLDALKVALTRLDHSPQKGKAFVGRSGALSNRRPPSRGSRSSKRSSADSLHLLQDQQDLINEDLVIPRVVNIEVQIEGDKNNDCQAKEEKKSVNDTDDFKERNFLFREQLQEPKIYKTKTTEKRKSLDSLNANQEIRKKLFETRYSRKSVGSNPLLNTTHEAEASFSRIKEEVSRLAAKRRSSSDISDIWSASDLQSIDSSDTHQRTEALKRWNEERESLLESASAILEKEGDENRSSSEADFVISDRESIADSGLINRRTVIKINEKKSKSATSLISDESTPLWIRDLQTRRSLRAEKEQPTSRVIPIDIDPEFDGGINVSIVNQSENPRRESTSRMYVRQCDSENRPSRASAFNVRRTIEKRQIQQERRERKALREKIREQLRSLSEGRERRDSSGSHVSSTTLSQNSIRSKSMSSLDQDQDDFRSESPLCKVQSSPTLEKEKEGVRSYLFGTSNLTETGASSNDMTNSHREDIHAVKREPSVTTDNHTPIERDFDTFNPVQERETQLLKSWDSLKTSETEAASNRIESVSKSAHSLDFASEHKPRSKQQTHVLKKKSRKETVNEQDFHPREQLQDPFTVDHSEVNDSSSIRDSLNSLPQYITPRNTNKTESFGEEHQSEERPIPPPRRHRLSLSTGHITLEGEEKPSWIRLAKERRSLRATKPVDQLSDRASTAASKEPEWVAKARKKLEALNVTLTSTTDFNSVSSHITESSSAWSRGGLDALDDLREETSRIGVELAEEASSRVNEDLGLKQDTTRMLEHKKDRSRDPSTERPRVSFEPSTDEVSDGDSSRRYRTRKNQKDEVRFGDLKHDWGGVQTKATKSSTGKTKEMRFGEIQTKETISEPIVDRAKEMRFGDHFKSPSVQKSQNSPSSPNGNLPAMRFGDTPLNLFPSTQPKGVQSSSKFESIAGPDPTKMTAEQLNQNVEEYDFPIPTGKEDVSEFMKLLEDSLKHVEIVPEVVISEDHKPKPKSILKRRSVENVHLESKKEEKSEFHQKVEHRKSASFDWDTVGKGGEASLDTGHTRNNGLKVSTEHYNYHSENSNRLKKSPQHDPPTSTSIATNSSFFNVKLRHVSPNKREPCITNEPVRFHTEHNLHRRSQAVNVSTTRLSENFSSLNTFTNSHELSGNHDVSIGQDNQGSLSSTASSQESLSESGGNMGQSETNHTEDKRLQHLEEYRKIVRKISKKEFPANNGDNETHISRWNSISGKETVKDEGKERQSESSLSTRRSVTMGSKTVRELLQKVQEPHPPAWGTCRAGRGLNTTEPIEGDYSSSPTSPVTHCDPTHAGNDPSDGLDTGDITDSISVIQDQSNSEAILCEEETQQKTKEDEALENNLKEVDAYQDISKELLHSELKTSDGGTNTDVSEGDVCCKATEYTSRSSIVALQKEETHIRRRSELSLETHDTCEIKDDFSKSSEGRLDYSKSSEVRLDSLKSSEGRLDSLKSSEGRLDFSKSSEGRLPEIIHDSGPELTLNSTLTSGPPYTASYIASYQLTSLVANTAIQDEESSPTSTTAKSAESPTETTEESSGEKENPSMYQQVRNENESPGKRRQAKVFSFTFSPDQKVIPKTSFIDVEQDSLIQQKTQKEVENKRRTEGMKTFTIITNPTNIRPTDVPQEAPQLNGHDAHSTASHPAFSKTKSNPLIKTENENQTNYSMKSPEVPARAWKKMVSSSSSERRKSTEKVNESSTNQKIHQIKVEVVDDEQKKIASRKRDEDRRRSSLLEWEALQRQRLEDEEKNRINKNLSMKPVSAKIKELVKMHGSFMSMFSKDKKTDINGTVDGKDDIVFRKMSSDNILYEGNNQPANESTLPMKSPYIVKKLLTPPKHHISEESKILKSSHKEILKPQTSSSGAPRVPHRNSSKTRTVRDRSQSPAKIHSMRDRSQSPIKLNSTRERSPSPAKRRTIRDRSQSPARLHSSCGRTPSPSKTHKVRGRSPSPANVRTRGRSPSPANGRSRGRSPSLSKSRILRERSYSPTKRLMSDVISSSTERTSTKESIHMAENIKVPERRSKVSKSILGENFETFKSNSETNSCTVPQIPLRSPSKGRKSLEQDQPFTHTSLRDASNTENSSLIGTRLNSKDDNSSSSPYSTNNSKLSQRISPPIPPKPQHIREKLLSISSPKSSEKEDLQNNSDKTSLNENKDHDIFSREQRKSEGNGSIKDPKNRKEWLNKMLNNISSDSTTFRDELESGTHTVATKDDKYHGFSENNVESITNTTNLSSSHSMFSNTATTINEATHLPVSPQSLGTLLSEKDKDSPKSSPLVSKVSSSLFLKAYNSTNSSLIGKSELSPPSTPNSLRSPGWEALHSDFTQISNQKRGPVSLSSILGDTSSRSSSLTSTPLTSPRATPERIIRKDSIDLTSKLDVIPESNTRQSINLSHSVDEHKENIAPFNRGSSSASPYRSPIKLRSKSPVKSEVNKEEGEGNRSSLQSPQIKTFTFGKPSVTMKTMVAGVDLQRVSTSRNSSSHPNNVSSATFESISTKDNHDSYLSNSYPRDNKDPIAARFSKERISLKSKLLPDIVNKDTTAHSFSRTSESMFSTPKSHEIPISKFMKEKSPVRGRTFSDRSTPDREENPVSLANILSRNDGTKYSRSDDQTNFQFKPNLSFSKELNDMTHKYRKDMAVRRYSSDAATDDTRSVQSPIPGAYDSDDVSDRNSFGMKGDRSRESSMDPKSKEPSPVREIGESVRSSSKVKPTVKKQSKETSCPSGQPKGLPKSSSTTGKQKNRIVRRNSSLKRNRPEDSKTHLTPKKERRDSEDDPADQRSESVVQNDNGWTKTKTTVRRARLGSSEKTKQILRTNSGKTKKEKTFKTDASKDLEAWAAGTNVDGKLMKKEGQRFSHETEEEVKGGKRTTRSVARRVVRRGSRRLSGGGELLTETKETSSKGNPKDDEKSVKPDEETPQKLEVMEVQDDGLSRKMKTSTDGERYMTHSVSNRDGKETFTTEGVNNKTTNSVEVIGGDDFEAKREVLGKTGHRVLVERSKDNLGRPSTVVKKITSQSRVVITKTKKKTPVVV